MPDTPPPSPVPPPIILQIPVEPKWKLWLRRGLIVVVSASLLANIYMYGQYQAYFAESQPPIEKYHSGEKLGTNKIARITISGTIMPPFSDRVIQSIDKARTDKQVKGVLLVVNSPGGLVTDSEQIYHKLKKLSAEKPVVVQMESMAASGGLYVAMGAGPEAKIYAEPTTWTGSIGVIIPRYEWKELADKYGVQSKPLKTGPFKDALSPFREVTPEEQKVWDDILAQSFDLFLNVIDENRKTLTKDQVRALATGQIYTAKDALKNGLVDAIGYEEETLQAFQEQHQIKNARVVSYEFQSGLMDALLSSMQARSQPQHPWQTLLEAGVPQAYFYCTASPVAIQFPGALELETRP